MKNKKKKKLRPVGSLVYSTVVKEDVRVGDELVCWVDDAGRPQLLVNRAARTH